MPSRLIFFFGFNCFSYAKSPDDSTVLHFNSSFKLYSNYCERKIDKPLHLSLDTLSERFRYVIV